MNLAIGDIVTIVDTDGASYWRTVKRIGTTTFTTGGVLRGVRYSHFLAGEGLQWIRGRHHADSVRVRAVRAARLLLQVCA